MRRSAIVILTLTAAACRNPSKTTETPASVGQPAKQPAAIAEGRALIEQGQLDAALAKLLTVPAAAESLYWQGVVWTRKAEAVPLPTPRPAGESPAPAGEVARAPEFKEEELRAIELFEKSIAAQPKQAQARIALADLLEPHAARKHDLDKAAAKRPSGRRAAPPPTPTPVEGEQDYRVERVAQLYRQAAEAEPTAKTAIERLLRFAKRTERPDDQEWALREMTKRDRENPDEFIRLGDFLIEERKDGLGAIEQYRQAMIWRPDDPATKNKIGGIYVAMGREHFEAHEYALSEARLTEAQKYITDPNSPAALQMKEYLEKLRAIRR